MPRSITTVRSRYVVQLYLVGIVVLWQAIQDLQSSASHVEALFKELSGAASRGEVRGSSSVEFCSELLYHRRMTIEKVASHDRLSIAG